VTSLFDCRKGFENGKPEVASEKSFEN